MDRNLRAPIAGGASTSSACTSEPGPFALEAHLGTGTPFGYAGLAVEYAPLRLLSFAAGAGWGSGRGWQGLQLAAGLRLRYGGLGSVTGTFEAYYSTGGWTAFDGFGSEPNVETTMYAERAHWFQLAAGLQYPFTNDASMRIYVGIATLLSSDDRLCELRVSGEPPTPCQLLVSNQELPFVPFIGAALRYEL
jgi:hypothetical protein